MIPLLPGSGRRARVLYGVFFLTALLLIHFLFVDDSLALGRAALSFGHDATVDPGDQKAEDPAPVDNGGTSDPAVDASPATAPDSSPENAPSPSPTITIKEENLPEATPTGTANDSESSHGGNIAFCMAVKDQSLDLPEFLVHHYYNIGIKHFYIMDDGSEPPLVDFAKDNYYGIPSKAITFYYIDRSEARMRFNQHQLYNDCNRMFGPKHDWLGYFDADEFIGTYTNETLADILRPFESDPKVGALGINWQTHTSAGYLTRQDSVREAYTECIFDDPEHEGEGSDNRHIKSLVKPSAYVEPVTPHKFILTAGNETVGEDGDVITTVAFRTPITRKRVGLHHYAVKSKQEYEEKMARKSANNNAKTWEFWERIHSVPHVECLEMTHWEV